MLSLLFFWYRETVTALNISSFTSTKAAAALKLLIARETGRAVLSNYTDNDTNVSSHDFSSPHFDTFYNNGGTESIKTMTNFKLSQFKTIWIDLQG